MSHRLSYAFAVLITCIRSHICAASGEKGETMPRGLQCYNCLSYDTPGCWDPEHPDFSNVTIPNIDCYIPGMQFYCIVITAQSAQLVETGNEIGPVRVRTCVPAKKFIKREISYEMCNKLSEELVSSEIFSKVKVERPKCSLCHKHRCTESNCSSNKRFFVQAPAHLQLEST